MKNTLLITLITLALFSSCQNKAKQHQNAVNDMMEKYGPDKKDQAPATATPPSSEISSGPLMGEWKTVLLAEDKNDNYVLDQEEKEKGMTSYQDYLKLNPDGSCEYTVAKIPGHYHIVEKSGNRSIEIGEGDSRVKYGRIISVTPDELLLMKFLGGKEFILYKRP